MNFRLKREGGRRVAGVCVKRGKLEAEGLADKKKSGRCGRGGGGGAKADSREGKLRRGTVE